MSPHHQPLCKPDDSVLRTWILANGSVSGLTIMAIVLQNILFQPLPIDISPSDMPDYYIALEYQGINTRVANHMFMF